MQKQVNITIPPEINFLELGLYRDDDGIITYNMSVFKSVLEYNNLKLEQLTQDDVEGLIASWYFYHRKNGGEPDMTAERIFNAVLDQPFFEPHIIYDAVIESPTPEQIRELREHTGMTQAQVASMLDLTNNQMISRYEQGRRSPNAQTWTLWLLLTNQHPDFVVKKR